ncbi:MAG: PAS domain S-box protein [Daejeonella sp.]|uniref:PAS domain-containing sensor histidine kinase n=1 Tax=Daejeonella sp. TaxID=2805397 RepID=UPI003C78D5F8
MTKKLRGEAFSDIFYACPAKMLIIDIDAPAYTILDVNNACLSVTNTRREDLIGKPVFGAFPGNPTYNDSKTIERTISSFEQAIKTKVPHVMSNYRYDIPIPGTNKFEERYWTTSNTPVLDENGDVIYLIHSPLNVTEFYKVSEREKAGIEALQNQEQMLYNIFMQAPVGIAVTDQVNAKQKIDEAEERARLAMDAVGLGTYDLNLLTDEIFTTKQFAKIFGFEEPVSRSMYLSAYHPDDLKLREKAHEDALISGELLFEGRVIWKDKSVRWVKIEGKVIYNDEKATRMVGTILDITEQRLAKEEQRKLIKLVDSSVDLMSLLNLQGINSYINPAGKAMLGFKNDEEVLNTPISKLHTPDDLLMVEREVLPTVMKEGKWSGTMNVRHLQSGEVFPVFNNCIRIDDPVSGEPIAVGAVMRDMRPELAAKQALAESEQLLRTITTAAPTALWMSDEKGLFTYHNQTWLDWTGRTLNENLGRGWLYSVHPEDRLSVEEKFLSELENKHLYEIEFRLNHSDGTIHWCVVNGQPQYRADGKFTGYIGACVDITDQKHLQQQKDDFIGIASHELKTPVTSIKAYTQVLEKMLQRKGDTKEAEMISRMDGQINRLTSLIGDLLDVTKISSGKLQFNDREFEFLPMVKELLEDLQRTTDKHTLQQDYEANGVVFGDKERIGQVISNLVTNAIKYSPHADQIKIHTSLKDGEIILSVTDFGIGISSDNMDKVFEQFYRVSGNMQHTFPGLGLGLYISSEIIKREGGRIWVNSKEGEGSTFGFSLPILTPKT